MGLGRPVVVVQEPGGLAHGVEFADWLGQDKCLAGLGQVTQCRQLKAGFPGLIAERVYHQVRRVHLVDLVVVKPADEGGRVTAGGVVGDDQGPAGQQGGKDLLGGDIEADGGELRGPVSRAAGQLRLVPGEQVDQRPAGHGDALGAAGGSGGVDDVRRVVDGERRGAVGIAGIGGFQARYGSLRRGIIQYEQRGVAGGGQCPGGLAVGEYQGGPGVTKHVRDPVRRVFGVDGQVGGTGFEYRAERDDQFRGAGQGERHGALRAHPPPDQQVGEAVGTGVEFGVAELPVRVPHRHRVGCAGRLGLEEFRQRGLAHRPDGVVPAVKDALLLGGAEQGEPAGGRGVLVRGGAEEAQQSAADDLDPVAVEEFGTVADFQAEGGARIDHQGERVVGALVAVAVDDAQAAGGPLEAFGVHRVVLEHHKGVEKFTGDRG